MQKTAAAVALTGCLMALGAMVAGAATDPSGTLVLTDGEESEAVALNVSAADERGCRVSFVLRRLRQEEIAADGETYRALTIPGGGVDGQVGRPGLPTYSGLLAVPAGRAVSATVVAGDERTFSDVRVLPVQPEDGRAFVIDAAFYRSPSPAAKPEVTIGEPAVMHGLRVVPFTVRPVSCDPAAGTLTVSSRLDIEFSFNGFDARNNPRQPRKPTAESFRRFFADKVLNGSGPAQTQSIEGAGLGTYLIICPEYPGVTAALAPLLDWRRRQGYTVQLATTFEMGANAFAIKNYIHNVYDSATAPLEFVLLVGDADGPIELPTWYESLSGYSGEGDHYYSTLDGDDVLPDVFIGRLSCRTTTQLANIVSKIVGYETAPPTTDAGWFARATVIGDPSDSGITTIYVGQWLKAQLLAKGYTQVDTIWSGNFPSLMLSSLNQGVSVFSYRGYYGVSGFTNSHISSSVNGGELPFAVFPTCDSGSWAVETVARNEAFLQRVGGGAIGAVGMATTGTHTRFNNCLTNGIWNTVINGSDHRLGVAQAGGKLELYANYHQADPSRVEIWSVWATLLGDPATDMWTGFPGTLAVTHASTLPVGVSAVPVTVTKAGVPLAGALVALYKSAEVSVTATTDASGQALLPLPSHTAGTLLVTAWGHNLIPYRGSLVLGNVNLHVNLAQTTIDDDDVGGSAGNGDGLVDPSETLELSCSLRNLGTSPASGVTATLTSSDPYVTVLDGEDSYGAIPAGAVVWGQSGFRVAVDASTPDGHDLSLTLTATSGATSWASAMRLPAQAPALSQTGSAWSLGGLDPGEQGTLSVTLANTGGVAAFAAAGVLRTSSPWITVTDSLGTFGDIGAGGTAQNSADPFGLAIRLDCFHGHLASFTLEVTSTNGSVQVVQFQLLVGTVSSDDPVGPDGYGYYAFDNTDASYLLAPTYAWVEIDPYHGGAGASVGLADFAYQQDDTRTLDLPFTFRYYGRDYVQVSVCSNGWVAMGRTTLRDFHNRTIPGAGSPQPMVAAFWDDLVQSGDNRVYSWHDAANHRFIVQWSRVTNFAGGSQNFEVILYDPAAHPTATGDGEILIQYETVNNNDTSSYCTTGIQSPDGTDGLLYTYYNSYAAGAAPLATGRAIRFLTLGAVSSITCDVTPGSLGLVLRPDEQATRILRVANNGAAGSLLRYRIDKVDPQAPNKAAGDSEKDLTGSYAAITPTEFQLGDTLDLTLSVCCQSPGYDFITHVLLDFPPGVVVNSATAITSGYYPLEFRGSTGDGATTVWYGDYAYIDPGGCETATVNVTFVDPQGDAVIPYQLTGYAMGGPPDVVTGEIVLHRLGPHVVLLSPDGSELWAINEQRAITFLGGGGPQNLRIELQRDPGGAWETVAESVGLTAGSYDWTVTGPISAHCSVRVSDAADPTVSDTSSGEFTIGRDLTWVTIGSYTGVVSGGQAEDVEISIDSSGLAEGVYELDLVLINLAGAPVTVPITLLVDRDTAVPDLTVAPQLAQNVPNPFNPSTAVRFGIPRAGPVRLRIFDAAGRAVRTLHDGQLSAGHHELVWDGNDDRGRPVASGLFLYRLETTSGVLSRKMVMMR